MTGHAPISSRSVNLAGDLAEALSRMADREGLALQPYVHLVLQRYVNEHARPDGMPRGRARPHDQHDEAGCALPPRPEPQADGDA